MIIKPRELFKFVLIVMFILPHDFKSQIITEIMFNPSEENGEFIEIYNNTQNPVDLSNDLIMYHTSAPDRFSQTDSSIVLMPGQYALVLEGDYEFTMGNYQFIVPEEAKVIFLDNNSFGRSGMANSSDRTVTLIRENLDTIDVYTYSADNNAGFSDERVFLDKDDWKNSLIVNGSPGMRNSVSPKSFDIGISRFYAKDEYVILGDSTELTLVIKNYGTSAADQFSLNIFKNNALTHPFYSMDYVYLNSGDSITEKIVCENIESGINTIISAVSFSKDQFRGNDSLDLTIKGIAVNEERGDIIINEFMYAPENPEPEWIEIFNRSDKIINIRQFSVADNKDTVVFCNKSQIVDPGKYFVIADDSLIHEFYSGIENFIISNLPSLNNSGDKIILIDSLGRVIDSLFYDSEWGGRNGNSLERIDPHGYSEEPSNWSSSLYPTPGKINSVSQKEYDLIIDTVCTIPEYPLIGSEAKICAKVRNIGKNDLPFSLSLFRGFKNDGKNHLIEESSKETILQNDSVEITFKYVHSIKNEKEEFIVSINTEDDDTLNNRKSFFISPSFPRMSLLINEVMYSPINFEPEWIELYNNTSYDIDLLNWNISDVLTNPVSRSFEEGLIFPLKSYLVITKSNNILDFHRNIEGILVEIPFANLNNDNDGVVIRDNNGRIIDSLMYFNDWGGNLGKSLERKSIDFGTNNKANWTSSIDLEGSTPGRINSTAPKDYDLSIASIFTEPEFPVKGEGVHLRVKINNYGIYDVNDFEVVFSVNENSIWKILETKSGLFLSAGDSLIIRSINEIKIADTALISVNILFGLDEDKNNNYLEKKIISGFNSKTVLINEIMFKTLHGNPQWIEIINNSDSSVNIKNWYIGDMNKKSLISDRDHLIEPDRYLVISEYSSDSFFGSDIQYIQTDLPELSKNSDAVVIYDYRSAVIDSAYYSVGKDFPVSTSLERISLKDPSEYAPNWIFCFDENRATPGDINSVNAIPENKFGDVIVSEIMFDPADNNCEFIEIFNGTANSVEIGGWSIFNGKGDQHTFQNKGFLLEANNYHLISADSSILINYPWLEHYSCKSILNSKSLGLNNDEGTIVLKDFRGNIIDSLEYTDSWHNHSFLTTKNRSLELINLNLSRNNGSNWSSSVSEFGASPGQPNSINVENIISNSKLEIAPNPFSPDNDGFEDFTLINYNLSYTTSQIRIRIFDSKGRFVRSLANHKPTGSKGSIIFDGLDKNKNPLRIGIYIILFEAVNNENKVVEAVKDVVVVARKL